MGKIYIKKQCLFRILTMFFAMSKLFGIFFFCILKTMSKVIWYKHNFNVLNNVQESWTLLITMFSVLFLSMSVGILKSNVLKSKAIVFFNTRHQDFCYCTFLAKTYKKTLEKTMNPKNNTLHITKNNVQQFEDIVLPKNNVFFIGIKSLQDIVFSNVLETKLMFFILFFVMFFGGRPL